MKLSVISTASTLTLANFIGRLVLEAVQSGSATEDQAIAALELMDVENIETHHHNFDEPLRDGDRLIRTTEAEFYKAIARVQTTLVELALEIDERGATPTGERVCRACGGRGERIVALDQGRFSDPKFISECRRSGWRILESPPELRTTVRMRRYVPNEGRYHVEDVPVPRTRIVVQPCLCPSEAVRPWRPETISLAWLVRKLMAAQPFVCDMHEWPAKWQRELDEREASGLTNVLVAWQAQWWRAFAEWAQTGGRKQPDVAVLAPVLASLRHERKRRGRQRPRRSRLTRDVNASIILGRSSGPVLRLDIIEARIDDGRARVVATAGPHEGLEAANIHRLPNHQAAIEHHPFRWTGRIDVIEHRLEDGQLILDIRLQLDRDDSR